MRTITFLIASILMLHSCNSNEASTKEESLSPEYLTILGNEIWVREYPTKGGVIMKLNDGDKCKVIKQDKKETIKGVTDFWYKIEFNEKIGFVFGSQTSLKILDTNANEFALIEGDDIALKEYPPNGEIIKRLKNNDKCKVIKKGEKQNIQGITDFWYKVEVNGITGWVFGAQTSIKQIVKQNFNYKLPKELIFYNFKKDDAIIDGLSTFYPIGWSKDNKFAYLKVTSFSGYESKLIIQDLITDKIINSLQLSEMEDKYFEKNLNLSETIEQSWNDKYDKITNILNKSAIVQYNNFELEKQVKINDTEIKINTKYTESDNFCMHGGIDYLRIFLTKDYSHKKEILELKDDCKLNGCSFANAFLLKNPYQNSFAILFHYRFDIKSSIDGSHSSFEIIGTDITKGFK